MKIQVEVEVPDGDFCREGENVFCTSFHNGEFCEIFEDHRQNEDIKKLPQCIAACEKARKSKQTLQELREKLAEIEHQRWADWQKYVHSVCTKNDDGTLTIPKWAVENWERQINTDYLELTEKEKDGDRKQVDRYLPLIKARKEMKENEPNLSCDKP